MHIKKWGSIISFVGFLGITFVWMKGISQSTGRDISAVYAGSIIPAPGPGQKKVVFKNLGMT